jgi:outer membrane protein assembly factor BamB
MEVKLVGSVVFAHAICTMIASAPARAEGTFEDLGVAVTKGSILSAFVGPDERGENNMLYFNFMQTGAPLFMMQIDTRTGTARQFNAPCGMAPWGGIVGPDGKVYIGTCGGDQDGEILRFDPRQPDKGIERIGKPAASETYIWAFTNGHDGRIYGCTYGNAKLVSYDTKTGKLADHGRMDDTQMYSRSVATGKDGRIYVGIGFAVANIVCYDPQTGKHRSVVPAEHRIQNVGAVWIGADGHAYGRIKDWCYRLVDGKAEQIKPERTVNAAPQQLADGRILVNYDYNGSYTLFDSKTNASRTHQYKYKGAGAPVFLVGVGPGGNIYGSTAMPCEMFIYESSARRLTNPGNPCGVGGEVYSFQAFGKRLFACAYPGSVLAVYDPARPWNFGTKPENNPMQIGGVGDGHLRPRAMILGPNEDLYIGSLPPYGQLGGAMGVVSTKTYKTTENYRNLIRNQSIVALAWDNAGGLIYGGSSTAGGGGTTPTEKEARFFAWDPVAKKLVFEIIVVPGDTQICALTMADGKVFGTSAPSNSLFVYDSKEKKIVRTKKIECGGAQEVSLGLHTDGLIYGLTNRAIFSVDPKTYTLRQVAKLPVGASCGWAMTDTGIYFGSGVHLWRYKW